jgi:flagellin
MEGEIPMRINTNVSALNTLRTLGTTGKEFSKSVGRLSSGFRINRAADDAAGLGIANKMRADLRSMRQASRNAEQASSVLQVAEGAAQTIAGIVDRMKELATQAASDNTDASGRSRIDTEFTELKNEITRIVDTTKFQDSVLLDGSMGNAVDAATSTADDVAAVQSISISGTKTGTYTLTQTTTAVTMSSGGKTQTLSGLSAGQQTLSFDLFGVEVEVDSTFNVTAASETFAASKTVVVAGGDTSFLVSSSGEYSGQDAVTLSSLDLSLATLGLSADALDTKANAVSALANIDTAIGTISDTFASIGAAQNRIEYAMQNTNAAVENISAAESVIRDVDMAAEVTQMTKYQILQQAGTAMLAQANQAPQAVLSLLR